MELAFKEWDSGVTSSVKRPLCLPLPQAGETPLLSCPPDSMLPTAACSVTPTPLLTSLRPVHPPQQHWLPAGGRGEAEGAALG